MENKKLAIEGHTTRYKEVIELFEMLGGKMKGKIIGNGLFHVYYINSDGNIDYTHVSLLNDAMIFTLEEFLKKYPYKVGGKVQHKGSTSCGTIYEIEKMLWEDNQIKYIIYNPYRNIPKCTVTVTAEDLQPFKEEIKAEDRLEIYADPAIDDDSKTDITIDGEKLIAPNGYTIKTATTNGDSLIVKYMKNKPQYPKTYKECCEVLGINTMANDAQGYKADDIIRLQELLIYRDAYWKIAGEEMGLLEPWKPYWDNNQFKFLITRWRNDIIKEIYTAKDCFLAFPTEEMRDAFFENFKDSIEECKEFL